MSLSLTLTPCTHIAPTAPSWLWEPYVPRGRLTVLDGEPGVGTSLLTTDLAARLSRGDELPDGKPTGRPNTVVLLSGEDDPADTILPRLVAAKANLANVIACAPGADASPLLSPEGIAVLRQLVEGAFADVLVLDPLASFLPAVATNDRRTREAMLPLASLASDTGCAVVLVRHRPAASGSRGLLGLARSAMRLTRHPDDADLRVLTVTKNAFGAPPASLGFRLAPGANGTTLDWTGAVDLAAEECHGPAASELRRRPRDRAAAFLKEALANGPRPVAELEKLAAEKGLNWRTIQRAKDVLKIQSELVGKGNEQVWQWFDPQQRESERARLREALDRAKRLMSRRPLINEPED